MKISLLKVEAYADQRVTLTNVQKVLSQPQGFRRCALAILSLCFDV